MNLIFNVSSKARFGEDVRYLEHGRRTCENFSSAIESQVVLGKTQLWLVYDLINILQSCVFPKTI